MTTEQPEQLTLHVVRNEDGRWIAFATQPYRSATGETRRDALAEWADQHLADEAVP